MAAYEEVLIRKIKGGIGAIKRMEKTPKEAALGSHLNNLQKLNPGQWSDLMIEYKEAIALHEQK